ncbi:MAG: hypothetical protein JWM76_2007 [Pseudonocardiales bacterium]|nr:hypothetical protein [Pseudonocardiales bacterium]
MTLDLYGLLFADQLDEVADRLDIAARAAADVYPLCTGANVVDLRPAAEIATPPGIRGV